MSKIKEKPNRTTATHQNQTKNNTVTITNLTRNHTLHLPKNLLQIQLQLITPNKQYTQLNIIFDTDSNAYLTEEPTTQKSVTTQKCELTSHPEVNNK